MSFLRRHGAVVAYSIVMVVMFGILLYAQFKQREAQRQACERGNVLRSQINVQGGVLISFLLIAADARDESADVAEDAGDLRKARQDRSTARQYRALVPTLTHFEQTDCSKI